MRNLNRERGQSSRSIFLYCLMNLGFAVDGHYAGTQAVLDLDEFDKKGRGGFILEGMPEPYGCFRFSVGRA